MGGKIFKGCCEQDFMVENKLVRMAESVKVRQSIRIPNWVRQSLIDKYIENLFVPKMEIINVQAYEPKLTLIEAFRKYFLNK